MNPKLQEANPEINLAELLRPSLPEMDLNQPVEASPSQPSIDEVRSTTDPLQINFATADIAGKLHNSRTSAGVKTFALIFVGGPTMLFGLGIIVMAWSKPELDMLRALLTSVLGLAMIGFWPYIIFANRRDKSRRS